MSVANSASFLPFLLLCLAIVLLVVRLRGYNRGDEAGHAQGDDRKFLRHTVCVNLNILEGELEELLKVGPSAQVAAADYDRARQLLSLSAQGAAYARARLEGADEALLQELLGIVFAAMSRSTEARRLLKQLR